MPARDVYHAAVKQALIKDGWTITHDPFPIYYGSRRGYIDLGAEQTTFAAEKGPQQIAVEVKSFVSDSMVADLEQALGQYLVYRSWLHRVEPARVLVLAVRDVIVQEVFEDLAGRVLIDDYQLQLVAVNMAHEEIVQWLPARSIDP